MIRRLICFFLERNVTDQFRFRFPNGMCGLRTGKVFIAIQPKRAKQGQHPRFYMKSAPSSKDRNEGETLKLVLLT